MAHSGQRPDPAPDPLLTIHDNLSRATMISSQSTRESPPTDESADDPPPFPVLKGLTLAERNAVRRSFEKAMFAYLTQHGTLSNDSEVCGPCSRTGTLCIRHPLVKKCALCFRSHDVCEIWDDSVQNIRRRRSNAKSPKKENKVPTKIDVLLICRRMLQRALRIETVI